MNRALALALPFASSTRFDSLDFARRMIVVGCGAALILAGRALPF